MNFRQQYQAYLALIEQALPEAYPERDEAAGGRVVAAARYSLLAGGKRIRPVLLLAVADLLGVSRLRALPYALAIEMIHTYSLIHDDLPSMDNDDLRRGRPTCHKVYGEALAILAGDALLNRAFELLLAAAAAELKRPDLAETSAGRLAAALAASQEIARAAGSAGMIAGQTMDLAAEGQVITAPLLRRLHSLKTGQLILAPAVAAALLADCPPDQAAGIRRYAEHIGLAFQIQDDILDVTANAADLGKSAGKDQRDAKSTYVSLFGLDEARRLLDDASAQASAALDQLAETGLAVDFLTGLTDYLLHRTH